MQCRDGERERESGAVCTVLMMYITSHIYGFSRRTYETIPGKPSFIFHSFI